MAPKAAAVSRIRKAAADGDEPVVDEAAARAQAESDRLCRVACFVKALSLQPAHANGKLRPSKALRRANGKDIVKKGVLRKSKYLFLFPGLLAPVGGGRLGTLAQLDSKNPVLYVEFSEGRLKLFGTIVYPKNRYLSLQIARSSIVCEDVFESLVVFAEAWWIGTKEANPDEHRLSLPQHLRDQRLHKDMDFTAGARAEKASAAAHSEVAAEQAGEQPAGIADDADEHQDGANTAPEQPVRASKRATAQERPKYMEHSESASEDELHNDQIEAEGLEEDKQDMELKSKPKRQTPKKATPVTPRRTPKKPAERRRSAPSASEEEDAAEHPLRISQRVAAKPRPRYSLPSDSEGDCVGNDDDDDEDVSFE